MASKKTPTKVPSAKKATKSLARFKRARAKKVLVAATDSGACAGDGIDKFPQGTPVGDATTQELRTKESRRKIEDLERAPFYDGVELPALPGEAYAGLALDARGRVVENSQQSPAVAAHDARFTALAQHAAAERFAATGVRVPATPAVPASGLADLSRLAADLMKSGPRR